MEGMKLPEAPTADRLIDHAWMVDCAVILQDGTGAAVAAERLFDELVLHDRDFERTRSYLHPHIAEDLVAAALSLRAGVHLLVEEIRHDTSRPRPALRSQVEKLILAEAAAVGDWASLYMD